MDYEKLNIKQWASDDRPREKMKKNGPQALSNAELLAILIGSGCEGTPVVHLCQAILSHAGNSLAALGRYGLKDLTGPFKGIGEAKALTIMAAMELSRRRQQEGMGERPLITSSAQAFAYMQQSMCDLNYEEFWVLMLNRAGRLIDKALVSRGGVSATVVDVKILLKAAIQTLASSIIICHNHPSGSCRPSREDENVTHKVKEAASLVDIRVVDHIIVCQNDYYSFADNGKL